MNVTHSEASRIMGGTLTRSQGSEKIRGAASIDTRSLVEGDLFFAMPGEVVDGHEFVKEAIQKGAAAAVVTREVEGAGPQIVVADATAAMVRLAVWVRDTINPVVVGITGSTGKTSVKDLLESIVGRVRPTVASRGSFNNELGLPLTLLRIKVGTEVVICEMGARGPGQIKALCELARPHVGVVTNVGVTHFETFGSQEAITSAKAELVQALPEGGAAVLNADDPRVAGMGSVGGASLTYGLSQGSWLRAESVTMDKLGRPSFRMMRGSDGEWVSLAVSGQHQVHNALAASAAALALGLTLEDCRMGLEAAEISAWRMETVEVEGVVIVNDAYNANPTSVRSALTTCAAMVPEGGRFVAVLGYMAELGELEMFEHRQIGALAASVAHRLVVVGSRAAGITAGALDAGMTDVVSIDRADEADCAVKDLAAGDVVLIKGSRVAALENVARRLGERLIAP